MNENELREYMAARPPSPNVERNGGATGLACHGCAHSAAGAPPPGRPSGERPCQACVRNPDRAEIQAAYESSKRLGRFVIDNRGNARCFDAAAGTQYNGVPMVYHPMDRYVTLDQRAQEDWLEEHPEYQGAIEFGAGTVPIVVETDDRVTRVQQQNPDGTWSPATPLKATWETDGPIMRWLASWVPWLRWRSKDGGKTEGLG